MIILVVMSRMRRIGVEISSVKKILVEFIILVNLLEVPADSIKVVEVPRRNSSRIFYGIVGKVVR